MVIILMEISLLCAPLLLALSNGFLSFRTKKEHKETVLLLIAIQNTIKTHQDASLHRLRRFSKCEYAPICCFLSFSP